MKQFIIQNHRISYYYLKEDFKSAYKNNGNNIELALSQVAKLRDLDKDYVKHILYKYIKGLEYKKCPNCKQKWNGIECNNCGMDTAFNPYWD
jgi:hypothetical protein